jgi:hypothetical protein
VGEAQYQRTLQNQRRAGDGPESLQAVVPGLIERAAGALHRRRRAQEAWEQIAKPEWLALTEVQSVEGGIVVVGVHGAARRVELCGMVGSLGRQLAQLAPGMSGVRFVVADGGGEDGPRAS